MANDNEKPKAAYKVGSGLSGRGKKSERQGDSGVGEHLERTRRVCVWEGAMKEGR